MKSKIDTQDIRWQTDDMNEWVMEGASQSALESEPPMVPVWTEPSVTTESQATVEGEVTISELLVNAGNEEAELEQRVSADILES
jgi:hypothetical protein